jgi:hypothetical protein
VDVALLAPPQYVTKRLFLFLKYYDSPHISFTSFKQRVALLNPNKLN